MLGKRWRNVFMLLMLSNIVLRIMTTDGAAKQIKDLDWFLKIIKRINNYERNK
jgi:hypothetical protein